MQTNAFEENDPKKAKKAVGDEGDDGVFVAESGKPSPGQLTADKASYSLFSVLLFSVGVTFLLCPFFYVCSPIISVICPFANILLLSCTE